MPDSSAIDVSVLLTPAIPVWPGDTPFSCLWNWQMSEGASVNVSTIGMSPHAGTHADSPLHVTEGGLASESLDLGAFNGHAVVVDMTGLDGEITLEALLARMDAQSLEQSFERLILRTERGVANGAFPESWPVLDGACASALVARGLRLLGVDAPSIDDRDSKTLGVHHAILDHGGAVLENLDLRGVLSGSYLLEALPLRIAGLDAAPVRALLTPLGSRASITR